MQLGFKARFVPMIEDGSKTHTIRAKRKIRPRVGETCHCYTGLRQKGARLLGRWPCVKVETIEIYERGDGSLGVVIDGLELAPDEKNELAWRDGFRSTGRRLAFTEMATYWRVLHRKEGPFVFEGDVIHWRP
jgi:hypothetical protein